jgi:hypothetical protein
MIIFTAALFFAVGSTTGGTGGFAADGNGAPQLLQNRAPGSLGALHTGQFI